MVIAVIAYLVTVIYAATMRRLTQLDDVEQPEQGLLMWPRWLLGLIAALLLIWCVYRVRNILLPFIVGAVAAYLLNPAIDGLERRGWARTSAIGVVFGVFLLIFVIAALLVIPAVAIQAQDLSANYQTYIDGGRKLLGDARRTAELWGQFVGLVPSDVRAAFAEVGDRAQSYALLLLRESLGWFNRSLVIVSLLIISPIVTFWLLRDYHDLGRQVQLLLPPDHRKAMRSILRDINRVAGSYLLGMGIMATIVAAYAILVLTIAGVPFSVLFGLLTGVLYVIPYVGYPTAVAISGLAMAVTGRHLSSILIVLAILVAGNVLADYGLYPRVVGRRVGLHPLVVIFALLAGGSLFGFIGVVLAVPLAGVIKVISLHFWPALFQNDSDPAPAS
jgi:predicted PurR-regulated permease PerM